MNSRVLLIGGYGGFGGRIAVRLAAAGWEVVVAGRSVYRATVFCAGRPRLVPLALNGDLASVLAKFTPCVVVDAAGPFQGSSYDIPRACLVAGCHYLDIADARDFVTGISELDAEARAAGLAVISGASSVPALSGAVVRALTPGMTDLRAVEIAISASNRATAGPSVTRAILSYVGKPIRIWRAGRWTRGYGWQDLRSERFDVAGARSIGPRLVALADVPDLDLLPDRLADRPAVSFRAGTELAVPNWSMWLLSWLVRWHVLPSLVPLGPALTRLQALTSAWGSDRSGMIVRLFGRAGAKRIERRWTLIASDGDGPEIPGLAIPILLDKLTSGTLAPGARDAGLILSIESFEHAFSTMAIAHQVIDIEQPPALYARIMGHRFDALPPAVRSMHDVLRDGGASGRALVTRGQNGIARLIADLVGFPSEGDHAVHVSFSEIDGVETWTRDFEGRSFRSRLSQKGERLIERFGFLRFAFELESEDNGLVMRMRRWWLGPLALPLAWAPRSTAREWAADGLFWFDVPIALPLIGKLVHYRGWLAPAQYSPPVPVPTARSSDPPPPPVP